jgi:hypothetical protein
MNVRVWIFFESNTFSVVASQEFADDIMKHWHSLMMNPPSSQQTVMNLGHAVFLLNKVIAIYCSENVATPSERLAAAVEREQKEGEDWK